jgi:hypothetical protein
MATVAEFEAVLATLSPDEMMSLKSRLNGDQIVRLTIPALLSQTQLDNLCEDIAAAYPPLNTALLALI